MPEASDHELQGGSGCSRAKAEGALIALAAGDALGWPQEFPKRVLGGGKAVSPSIEFRTWMRRGGGRFYPYEDVIRAGEYSDDTQLSLAVGRSRLFGSAWWSALTRTEIPLWTLYERGGGGATKRAAESWLRGTPPWRNMGKGAAKKYFEAGGNGVAMRVLPHAIYYAGVQDAADLIRDAVRDGVATHGHPRALVGATVFAYAAWWLLRTERTIRFGELVEVLLEGASTWGALPSSSASKNGWMEAAHENNRGDYGPLWQQVVEEMTALLRRIQAGLSEGALADDDEMLDSLGCFGQAKGAGTVSAAAAVYLCSRYAAQPVQAVLRAAFARGADTDTIAAMAGALMGCVAGTDWLPREWHAVQDCECLSELADRVAQGPSGVPDNPQEPRPIRQKDIEALQGALLEGHRGELDLDGLRRAHVLDCCAPAALSKSTTVQVWQLRTSDGQTLYVTKLGRRPKNGPDRSSEPAHQRTIRQEVGHPATSPMGIKLSVERMREAMRFYKDILGLQPSRQSSRFVCFGSISLVDAKYAKDLSAGAVDLSAGPGRSRVAVETRELEALYHRLVEAGVEILQQIFTTPWGQRGFHCRDPEGHIVEVLECRDRPPQ